MENPKMDRLKNQYTVLEKAIIVLGIKANISPNQIQLWLTDQQRRLGLREKHIPASVFAMVKPVLLNMNNEQVWEYIQTGTSLYIHPHSLIEKEDK